MAFTNYKDQILENLTDGVWLFDEEEDSLIVSSSFWQKIDRPDTDFTCTIQHLSQFVFDGDVSSLDTLLKKQSPDTGTSSEIIRFIRPDGLWVWFEVKSRNLAGYEGKRAFLLFDISTAKEREHIYNAFDSINRMGGWYVNIADMKSYWTPYLYEVHALPAGTTPPVEDAINFYKEGESRDRISEVFGRSIQEGIEFDGEFEFIDAKGTPKWVRSRGKPVMENGVCKMVYGTIQDITKEKEKEFAALASKQKFEDVFNSTFQFCGILESDGTLIEVNKTALDFADMQPEEVLGKKFWDTYWGQVSPETKAQLQEGITKAAAGIPVRFPITILDRDRKETTVDFSFKSIHHGGGSARVIAEGRVIQELIDAQRSLENMISRVNKQNDMLTNFAHIVSHNLRSHASNISLLAGIFSDSISQPIPENLCEMLSKASTQLEETLGHVSEIVVITNSGGEGHASINLKRLAENTIASLSAIISSAHAEIRLDLHPDINVSGVTAYVESVFLNMITNAVKYRSKERPCVLTISAEVRDNTVRIDFTDNGLGLDLKRYESKVFGMYKTFHGNDDAKGIGLYITRNQVEAMGGKIEVDSEVDQGSTFAVTLYAG